MEGRRKSAKAVGSISVVLISSVVVAVTALPTLVVSATTGSVISSATAATKVFFVLPSPATPLEIIALKILVAVLDKGCIAEFELTSGDVV